MLGKWSASQSGHFILEEKKPQYQLEVCEPQRLSRCFWCSALALLQICIVLSVVYHV